MSTEKIKNSISVKDYNNKKPVYLGIFFKFKDELDGKVLNLKKKVIMCMIICTILLSVVGILILTK